MVHFLSAHFVKQKCPTLTVTRLDLTEKSVIHRISLDFPILLESNLGCFQRVPPLLSFPKTADRSI